MSSGFQGSRLFRWLDERFGAGRLIEWAGHKTVPVHRGTVFYYMGGVCLFLFIVQVLSGILLLMYYRVGPDSSFESVHYITTKVDFGWLIRSVHSWAANLLVFFIFIHMFSVYFMKSFRKPRELTWVSGFVLLCLAMAFGFSGYLLPWNELAFFATKVGTDIIGELPLLGEWMLKIVRGGEDVTGATLSRFFGLHVAILPGFTVVFLGIHLLFVQVQGMSHEGEAGSKAMPFFPNFLLRDLALWLVILNVLAILAVFFPWELGKKADALASAPEGIKPEWYFLFTYQTLKLIPGKVMAVPGELLGIVLFNLAGLLWFLVPFWDAGIPEGKRDRAINYLGLFVVMFIIAMTIWGKFS
ncbi:MAG: cytochrome bc complex cytochrome b subunit [Elusimicrobia bacterium RIFCSPLOWO2_01_FULL_64_13]|nr:MAG: cytochrome bc complex cytochrome b subunit [Elusimicrobia bacterium RIFCSPHIGHO2_01_FULL_64_10]OGR97469.1 MAG: cytochrome bc complex cytochrome b subunit [Elusimicrobia bacterium RIFCSPLOWO2_01_FULL_64_13]